MSLSEILGNLKNLKDNNNNSPSMAMSKKMMDYTKSSGKVFDKLLNVQKNNSSGKKELSVQQDISMKTSMMVMKVDSLTKVIQSQTRLLEQNNRIMDMSAKYLLSINQGLTGDRQSLKSRIEEEKRNRRGKNSNGSVDMSKDKINEKSDGILSKILPFILGSGIVETIASYLGLSKVLKLVKTVKNPSSITDVGGKGLSLTGKLIKSTRSFLFGEKTVDTFGMFVSKTDSLFGKISNVGKSVSKFIGKTMTVGQSIYSFLGKTVNVIKDIGEGISDFFKIPQIISGTIDLVKNIPVVSKVLSTSKNIINAVKTSSVVQKGVNLAGRIGDAVVETGKSAYKLAEPTINLASRVGDTALQVGKSAYKFVEPAVNLASRVGSSALGLGGDLLSSAGKFLAPTTEVASRVGSTGLRMSSGIASGGEAVAGVGAKVASKSLGRLIPLLGMAISSATAAEDYKKKDYVGAGLNGGAAALDAAAIASTASGIGIIATPFLQLMSGALTIADMIRTGDLKKVFDVVTDSFKNVAGWVSDNLSPTTLIGKLKDWWNGTKTDSKTDSNTTGTDKSTPTGSTPPASGGGILSWGMDKLKTAANYWSPSSNTGGSAPTSNTGGGSGVAGASASPTGMNSNSLALSAIRANETSTPNKIVPDAGGYAVGKYQINSASNPQAWYNMGFTKPEVDRVNSGDIGFAQARLNANPQLLAQADIAQEGVLNSNLSYLTNLFNKYGADVSDPAVQAQLMDISNQFNIGDLDQETVQKMMKFSGGKKITPQGVLQWRLQTLQGRKKGGAPDQNRRFNNVNNAFTNSNVGASMSGGMSVPTASIGSNVPSTGSGFNYVTGQGNTGSSLPNFSMPTSAMNLGTGVALNMAGVAGTGSSLVGGNDVMQSASDRSIDPVAQSQANNFASIAAKNINKAGNFMGKCYGRVWKDMQQAGLGLNPTGGSLDANGQTQMSAFNFAEWADTPAGQHKLDSLKIKDPNQLQSGDIVVYGSHQSQSGSYAGHIEVITPNGDAASDGLDTKAKQARKAISDGRVLSGQVHVYRLKGAGNIKSVSAMMGVPDLLANDGTAGQASSQPSLPDITLSTSGIPKLKMSGTTADDNVQNLDFKGMDAGNGDLNKKLTKQLLDSEKPDTTSNSVPATGSTVTPLSSPQDKVAHIIGSVTGASVDSIKSTDKLHKDITQAIIGSAGASSSTVGSDAKSTVVGGIKGALTGMQQGNDVAGKALLDSITASLPAEVKDKASYILDQLRSRFSFMNDTALSNYIASLTPSQFIELIRQIPQIDAIMSSSVSPYASSLPSPSLALGSAQPVQSGEGSGNGGTGVLSNGGGIVNSIMNKLGSGNGGGIVNSIMDKLGGGADKLVGMASSKLGSLIPNNIASGLIGQGINSLGTNVTGTLSSLGVSPSMLNQATGLLKSTTGIDVGSIGNNVSSMASNAVSAGKGVLGNLFNGAMNFLNPNSSSTTSDVSNQSNNIIPASLATIIPELPNLSEKAGVLMGNDATSQKINNAKMQSSLSSINSTTQQSMTSKSSSPSRISQPKQKASLLGNSSLEDIKLITGSIFI